MSAVPVPTRLIPFLDPAGTVGQGDPPPSSPSGSAVRGRTGLATGAGAARAGARVAAGAAPRPAGGSTWNTPGRPTLGTGGSTGPDTG
jgi:hypothetical protein